MLTFILIGGLVWLAVALVFVLALAAAARKQISPVAVNAPAESIEQEKSRPLAPVASENTSSPAHHPVPVEEPVAT